MFYRRIIFPLIVLMTKKDPEVAHEFVAFLLQNRFTRFVLGLIYRPVRDPRLEQEICGITFPNPVGCAAGFDKEGTLVSGLERLGFGAIEVGTVVPDPEDGNDQPRLFRIPCVKALINRMGFNSPGVIAVRDNLVTSKCLDNPCGVPVGISIGKNPKTSLEKASNDHQTVLHQLLSKATYIAVNISSPNSPGLRNLQSEQYIEKVLQDIVEYVQDMHDRYGTDILPLFVKIDPDQTDDEVRIIIRAAKKVGFVGIIACNSSKKRFNIDDPVAREKGGLSGPPLFEQMCEIVRLIRNEWHDSVIIAVGGIDGPEKAMDVICFGADLIQIYTGFVYNGPQLIRQINRGILSYMKCWGYESIADMRGQSYPPC